MSEVIEFIVLCATEIVLNLDNIIFVSLVVDRLPGRSRTVAKVGGLGLALALRIVMLYYVNYFTNSDIILFSIVSTKISVRDAIFAAGGSFLIYKGSQEIYHAVKHVEKNDIIQKPASFTGAIAQIIFIDFVFSLDSIMTAVGISNNLNIIVLVVIISFVLMLFLTNQINSTISKFPLLKISCFLLILLIGVYMVLSAVHIHINKIYLYLLFALLVLASRTKLVHTLLLKRFTAS